MSQSLDDVIVAISSGLPLAGDAGRCIARLSGAGALAAANAALVEPVAPTDRQIVPCRLRIGRYIVLPAMLYYFAAPRSYTGQETVELHFWAAADVAAALIEQWTCPANGAPAARLAKPGEFTQRAFLNGKLDLMQAEAVAHLIACGSQTQIHAAQTLLSGRFSQTVSNIAETVMGLLCQIEADLDFSDQDIPAVDIDIAAQQAQQLAGQIQRILDGSVQQEALLDLPTAGLAGLTNAGKSALFNALLARPRSIVSDRQATTRDVLPELLDLPHSRCILFDCAGFFDQPTDGLSLDALAIAAARHALASAALILFCVDISQSDWRASARLFEQMPKNGAVLVVATKADAADARTIARRLDDLRGAGFPEPIALTSAKTGQGIDALRRQIQAVLAARPAPDDRLSLNARHRQHLQTAADALAAAAADLRAGRQDAAAMLLRQARLALAGLEYGQISEEILDRIFSQFCIGK